MPERQPNPSGAAALRRGRAGRRAAVAAPAALAALLGLALDLPPRREHVAAAIHTAQAARHAARPTALPESYRYDGVLARAPSARPDGPAGLDVAGDGRIYVAEPATGRVSVWRPDGGTEPDLASPGGASGLIAPEDVAVAADGRLVFVADAGAGRVQVYERSSGALAASWDGVGVPRGIAAGPDGRVYVADAEGHRIEVRDAAGGAIATWGGPGTAPGRFDTPLGLAVGADGSLLVADHGNQRVQRLAPDGSPIEAIALDNAAGPGGAPLDVGADDDAVYVAVARGVLRFRGGRLAGVVAPLEPAPPADCPIPDPCRCREVRPVENNHEGVARLAASERLGLYFTYAPALRPFDRIVALPARGFPSVIPWRCDALDGGGLTRAWRVDAAGGRARPVVLGRARGLWRAAGGPGDATPLDPADDVALAASGATLVVSGNQVGSTVGVTMTVLDPDMMTRRDRAGDRVPDAGWWHTALAVRDLPGEPAPQLVVAVLDAGRQRVTLRRFPDGALVGQIAPGGGREPFRFLADVAFDARGWLWIAARDGALWRYDASGRLQDRLDLAGPGREGIVALAVDEPLDGYVLTARGRFWKVAGRDGSPLALVEAAALAQAAPRALGDLAVDSDGAVHVTDGAAEAVHRFVADVPGDDPAAGTACRVNPDKRAAPARVALGEPVTVTLTLDAACPGLAEAHDVVLVADAGCQVTGRRLAALREAGARLADRLAPDDRLALVRFTDEDGGARLVAPLSADRAEAAAAARALRNECLPPQLAPGRGVEGRLSDGLRAAYEALTGPAARDGAGRAAIVVSPSRFDTALVFARLAGLGTPLVPDRQHARYEGGRLADLGARVFAIALPEELRPGFPLASGAAPDAQPGPPDPTPTPDPRAPHPSDEALLAALAVPPSGFRAAADADDLPALVEAAADALAPRPVLAPLVITDALPANMRLVPGSARPPAEELPGGILRWRLAALAPGQAVVLRYELTPLEAGRHPTNLAARAVFTDGLGLAGDAVFPVPHVDVIAPDPTASATTEPTPIPPDTATATVGPSATTAPTATPTRRSERRSVYLPRTLNDACQPTVRPVDVALLIDTSSSMNGAKLAAAAAAARSFVGLLDLPRDHAALVRFDRAADIVAPLTGDRARLVAALDRLSTAVGTRIDLGLWTAIGAVRERGRARAEADPVVVLLTDGRTEGGSEGAALQAAALARDVGIALYAIALGDDAAPDYLAALAGGAARVRVAPNERDLARVYAEIARAIPCR